MAVSQLVLQRGLWRKWAKLSVVVSTGSVDCCLTLKLALQTAIVPTLPPPSLVQKGPEGAGPSLRLQDCWVEDELESFIEGMEKIGVGQWKTILDTYPEALDRRDHTQLQLKWVRLEKAVSNPPADPRDWKGGLNPDLASRVDILMRQVRKRSASDTLGACTSDQSNLVTVQFMRCNIRNTRVGPSNPETCLSTSPHKYMYAAHGRLYCHWCHKGRCIRPGASAFVPPTCSRIFSINCANRIER
jgi:hypothetical protein